MKKRILVLDDDQPTLDTLHEVLTYLGFEVLALNQSQMLWPVISNFKPNLVLIDYMLDGRNGGNICRQLKTRTATMHIPVIMMSAYARAAQLAEYYSCDSFIAKPFNLTDLTDALNYNISRYQDKVSWCYWAQTRYAC